MHNCINIHLVLALITSDLGCYCYWLLQAFFPLVCFLTLIWSCQEQVLFISHDNGLPIFLIVLNLNQFYWGIFTSLLKKHWCASSVLLLLCFTWKSTLVCHWRALHKCNIVLFIYYHSTMLTTYLPNTLVTNLPWHICHSNFLCILSLCVFFTYGSLEHCYGLSL